MRHNVRRFTFPLIGSLLAVFLTACDTSSSGSGDSTVSSLTEQQPAQQAPQVKPIAFAPVIGAPAKVSSKMSERLVAAAGQSNIPVASSGEADYTIRGYLVAASDPKGTKLSYIWDITDKDGKRSKRIQGDELIEGKKGGDPWALVDDTAIDRIASSTAEKIGTWMSGNAPAPAVADAGQARQPAAPSQQAAASSEPAPQAGASSETSSILSAQAAESPDTGSAASAPDPKQIVAVVPPVTGAPGDGQTSLTAAMRRHLQDAGVTLAEGTPSNAAYTVKGTVQLGAADSGQQPITIRWLVVDPTGKPMEKAVVQRNKVPAGSLDGSWGQIADLAASEAAKSVAKLIKPTG